MHKRYAVSDCLLLRGVADVPYLQEGGGTANSQYEASGPHLLVEPEKILELKHRLEARRDKINSFLAEQHMALKEVETPGADPCSEGTVKFLSQNGQTAILAAEGFVAELGSVVEQLDRIAKDYQLLEEDNADKFPGPR